MNTLLQEENWQHNLSGAQTLSPPIPLNTMNNFTHIGHDLPDLTTRTIDSKRHYIIDCEGPDPIAYPSITSILGWYSAKGIQQWRKRVGEKEANRVSTQASRRGTSVHQIIEDYVNNKEDYSRDLMPIHLEDFNKIKTEIDEHLDNIRGLEVALYSHKLRCAGRSDCIAEWKGQPSILDWKTSRRVKKRDEIWSYFVQSTFYATAWEELTGEKLENIVIVMSPTDHDVLVFEEKVEDWYDLTEQKIDQWYRETKGMTLN